MHPPVKVLWQVEYPAQGRLSPVKSYNYYVLGPASWSALWSEYKKKQRTQVEKLIKVPKKVGKQKKTAMVSTNDIVIGFAKRIAYHDIIFL